MIIFSFIILSILFILPVRSQSTVSLDEVKQAGLHIVEITTLNGEEPQGKNIESPLFPGSYNMIYSNKVPCRIIISKDNELLYVESDESKALDASRLLYNKRFGYSYLTVSHDIQQLQKWYQNHIDRLNEQIMQIDTNTTDIQISKINNNNAERIQYYSLSGIEIDVNKQHCITVYQTKNGKISKIINKR